MIAVVRMLLATLLATVRRLVESTRQLAESTILRSKHWPSDGIARRAFLAAAAISAVVLLTASAMHPYKVVWS
jgi:hypothetical protein